MTFVHLSDNTTSDDTKLKTATGKLPNQAKNISLNEFPNAFQEVIFWKIVIAFLRLPAQGSSPLSFKLDLVPVGFKLAFSNGIPKLHHPAFKFADSDFAHRCKRHIWMPTLHGPRIID